MKNIKELPENPIIVGCNYHTKWQNDARMRFVLKEIKDGRARLVTRHTNKNFWTNISDLIFIQTNYNKQKALEIINSQNQVTL